MGRLVIETWIAAPREIVFDLARDVEVHARCAAFTHERVTLPGRVSGLLELGDLATFEGRHFGVRQRFTLRIVEMDPPARYVDELVRSVFPGLRHSHEFESLNGGTWARDTLEWKPWPLCDFIARRILDRYVSRRQLALKGIAEAVG